MPHQTPFNISRATRNIRGIKSQTTWYTSRLNEHMSLPPGDSEIQLRCNYSLNLGDIYINISGAQEELEQCWLYTNSNGVEGWEEITQTYHPNTIQHPILPNYVLRFREGNHMPSWVQLPNGSNNKSRSKGKKVKRRKWSIAGGCFSGLSIRGKIMIMTGFCIWTLNLLCCSCTPFHPEICLDSH